MYAVATHTCAMQLIVRLRPLSLALLPQFSSSALLHVSIRDNVDSFVRYLPFLQ